MSSRVPEGWNEPRVRDLFTLNTKSVVPNDSPQEKFTYFSLPAYDEFGTSIEVYGSEIESNKFEINDTSVLVSKLNPRKPRVMYAKPEELRACASTEFMSFVPIESSGVSLNYFTHYFFSELFQKRLELVATGSTNSHVRVSPKETTNWRIAVPPLPEQKKIASILTSVDEVIENTQKQIDKLQDLKKATMNELLTKGIGHTEFKDSELGRIPKSWEVMRMRSIAQVIDSLHETPTFSDFGIPMVRVTDIKRGDLSVDNAKTVSEEDYRKFIKKYEPQLGDIVMSRVGSYGVSSYVSSDKPFCMGQNTVIINPVDISGRFLYECLESDCIQRQIELEVAGSGYKSLSLADIRALAIPVPPMHEQERIRGLLLSIDGQVIVQKQKLTQTQSLKKSLMQDLLTGKVRVTVN